MKYVIVHTWNGEGYSWKNTAEVMEFSSDDKAQQYIVEQAHDEADALAEFTEEWGNVSFDDDEDQGSVQWFAFTPETYGVVIRTNVNEVQLVNEQEYHEQLKVAIAQADPEDAVDEESPFINGHDGEYDYQFIKF
jgi:hypothetical protein